MEHARVDGGELRYLRTGSGPTVVLLHTLRTQLEYWSPLRRAIGSGLDVIAPDLPGHGRSSAPPAAYDATYFIDTIERFLDVCDVQNAVLVGESIGGSIALGLAARHNRRIARLVAVNPYDYGRGGGVRRSSALANILFAMFGWPVIGPLALRMGTKGILRRVLEGGFYDRSKLPPDLVDELWECGALPGHATAFLSLSRQWQSWISARDAYASVHRPVTLLYADHDWSRPDERAANSCTLALATSARTITIAECGHFASLERPDQIAEIIREEARAL